MNDNSLRSMMAAAQGNEYLSLSFEDAKQRADAYAVLEGDYGGQIYLVVPLSEVQCSENALRQLLADLDAMCWSDLGGAQLSFECFSVGSVVSGGMGGGRATGGLWLHDRLTSQLSAVVAVLAGTAARMAQ